MCQSACRCLNGTSGALVVLVWRHKIRGLQEYDANKHTYIEIFHLLDMLSQSEALRFEEVFSKFAGKEFSDRIAQEEIQEALAEMKANPASEGLNIIFFLLTLPAQSPSFQN